MDMKNNAKVSKKTCRKKQQQESLPACERTGKLETRENRYHPKTKQENVSQTKKIFYSDGQSAIPNCKYTHNKKRSQGARCPSTNRQRQIPHSEGEAAVKSLKPSK